MQRRWLRLSSATFLIAIIVISLLAVAERQNIFDWLALRNYQPPAAIVQLANQTTMNAYTRKVFYVNHPAIDEKSAFNQQCPDNDGENIVVLGCYHPGQKGIFLLHVTDTRLNGVEEVTAAHEVLHAVYARLSARERNYVDGLLMNYYQHDLHNKRILAEIAEYKQSEPNAWVDEMHSTFGTEISQLPTPLDNYYKQFFTNRQKIVSYEMQYQSALTARESQVVQDDASLTNIKGQVNADEQSLQTKDKTITNDQTKLENLKNSGDYTDYNAGVPGYDNEVDTYNSLVYTTKNLINQYNQLVTARNAIAIEENQLEQELSAAPQPISQ